MLSGIFTSYCTYGRTDVGRESTIVLVASGKSPVPELYNVRPAVAHIPGRFNDTARLYLVWP